MKYVCTVCGYVYEGESLPADFVCPVCKAPASKFAAQTGEREWAAEHCAAIAIPSLRSLQIQLTAPHKNAQIAVICAFFILLYVFLKIFMQTPKSSKIKW